MVSIASPLHPSPPPIIAPLTDAWHGCQAGGRPHFVPRQIQSIQRRAGGAVGADGGEDVGYVADFEEVVTKGLGGEGRGLVRKAVVIA